VAISGLKRRYNQQNGRIPVNQAQSCKPFVISKHLVWQAYKRVRANRGSAGVDGQSIAAFEERLGDNLYKVWNRLSSGSYFPPPVRRVAIPKGNGGTRLLGIPTVGDRVAQMVVKMVLEPLIDPIFHPDSYGYRPGKSALDAVGAARKRCWRRDWVVDLDIKGFFDTIDHELLMRAVRKHVEESWVIIAIERWLRASVQLPDGTTETKTCGTPQGGVISPLLANLFLHYVFDDWLRRNRPEIQFERYADDGVCHCRSRREAEGLLADLRERFEACRLTLHPEKTKIVYCQDDDRRRGYPVTSFDFLGYTFRARRSKNRHGKFFVNFSPAMSNASGKRIREEMRSWKMHLRSDKSLDDLGRMFRPKIMGWINYYGRFYKSAMYPTFQHLDRTLSRWVERKFKRFRGHPRRAAQWLQGVAQRDPNLFPHWRQLWRRCRIGM
jgi:group II intron reverse transcriptase/maturase